MFMASFVRTLCLQHVVLSGCSRLAKACKYSSCLSSFCHQVITVVKLYGVTSIVSA